MIQAGSMGVPFVPVRGYAGSDVIAGRDDFTTAPNPFNPDERYVIAKAINPDVAIFHGLKADRKGNVLVGDRNGLLLAMASRKVIVTVEEIVDVVTEHDPTGWYIPAIHITAVAQVPYGAYPTACPDYYDADDAELLQYVKASVSDEAFANYLTEDVFAAGSHDAYIQQKRITRELAGLTP